MNERNYFVDIACARIPSNPGFRGPASSVANEVFSGVKSGSAKPGRTILPKREWLLIYLASAASPCFLSTFNVFLACRSGGLIDQPRNFTVGTVDRVFSSVVTDKKVNSRDPFRYSDTYLRESLQPQLTSLHRSHLLATYVRTTSIAYDGAGSRYTRPIARGREQIQRRARHPHPRYESVLVAIGDGISSSAREGAVRSRQADDQDHTPPGNYQVTHHIRLAVRSVGEAGGPTRGR